MKILKYLAAAVLSAGLALSSMFVGIPTANATLMSTQIWSGYAVKTAQTGLYYKSVSGSWKVPKVAWGQTAQNPYGFQYNTIWIGIGGAMDGTSTLIQMGTESIVNAAGVQTNYVWAELYPAVSRSIPYSVGVGDTITSSIVCTANCNPGTTQTWKLTISDVTRGWTWTQIYSYASSMRSAEWVVESPTYNQILPLNNYGKVNWTNITANGVDPGLTLNANSITMRTPAGQTSNPSSPAGNAFSTCYGYSAFTPCSYP